MNSIIFLIIVFICQLDCSHVNDEGCITRIPNGGLLGTQRQSRSGRQFCAFLGIPFAAPPIGKLRFLPPQSPQTWEEMKNFTQESAECVQTEGRGSEDCLYLNVYTQNIQQNHSVAVMVYIHGGGFRLGSASTSLHGPEYLMDKNIVLVTLQYRLGPFGFLSTEDKVIPGNMGMKDQVKALQWVQGNIEYFGGNPGEVTLFGNSAGGASVHLHMLSSASRGLFARGISQSGTAFSGFAVAGKGINKNITLTIASKLNCSNSDSNQLLNCMQSKTADEIISVHYQIIQPRYNRILLRPNVEINSEHAFLTSHPRNSHHDKPWLVGISANEGITFLPVPRLKSILPLINSSFNNFVPELTFLENEHSKSDEVVASVYDFYFNNRTSTNDQIESLEQMITDSWFAWPTENALANHNQTFYYYLYDHLGEHSYVEYYNSPQGFGVAHCDELLTLFSTSFYPHLNKQDLNISKLMVDLWVNFATEGNPTPDPISTDPQQEGLGNFTWEVSNKVDRKYLHIQTHSLQMKKGLFSNRMEFWRQLESNKTLL